MLLLVMKPAIFVWYLGQGVKFKTTCEDYMVKIVKLHSALK